MESRIFRRENQIYRVFAMQEDKWFVLDCNKPTIPKWINKEDGYDIVSEEELKSILGVDFGELEEITPKRIKVMNERFTMISGLLPFLQDREMRGKALESIAMEYNISKQTLRRYLCSYLVYMDKRALLPVEKRKEDSLTIDEKNMRWSLNKFFYNSHKNTLKYAYRMMLKEKYTDETIVFNDGEKDVERKEYDSHGNVTRIQKKEKDSEDFYNVYLWGYEYNEDGKKIATYHTQPDGTYIYCEATYEYDENGNLVKEIEYDSDGNVDRYYLYKNDDKGNVLERAIYEVGNKSGSEILEYTEVKANGYYDAESANNMGFDTSDANRPGFDYTQKKY